MPDVLQINERVAIPLGELEWRFSRSGGPGGQHVNTSDSRAELSFDIANTPSLPLYLRQRALRHLSSRLVGGVLTITASESRSQLQNRRAAERRLVEVLAAAIKPPAPPRRPTKPTKGSKERRLEGKRHRGEIKRNRRNTDD